MGDRRRNWDNCMGGAEPGSNPGGTLEYFEGSNFVRPDATRMQHDKRWNVAESDAAAQELAGRLKTSPLIAQILLNRGLRDHQECSDFLQPSLKCLHDPASIPNLTRAADRIAKAIRDREKIVIYGDYDVDGITATAILWHAVRRLGGQAEFYVPHRIDEGYGLNAEAVAQLCEGGAKLIVTVDCGITAIEPARVARDRGVDLIVTDHHEWHREDVAAAGLPIAEDGSPQPLLPDCFAIVHPRLPREGAAYPNPHLCGAGVAFKLAWGIGMAMSGAPRVSLEFREFLIEATALAALGTIADVVPLIGENRVLAHFGLSGLRATRLAGLRALIASAGLTGQNLDSFHVGFLLAPRLNACGRMGHARQAVEMLTIADEKTATETATYLEQQNRQRQILEREILDQATAQIDGLRLDDDEQRAIVLAAEGWHPGIIGIVASRIVDRFHRPAILVALNNGLGQGSGRSVLGFHLARALEACGTYLDAYGGHEMAAGLKISAAKFDDFQRAFRDHARQFLPLHLLVPELQIDCTAELRQVTAAVVGDLHRLGPFGHGNRRPLMACRNLEIAGPPRRVGKTGDHLQIQVRQGQHLMKCIAFGYGELCDRLPAGTQIDLAVEPALNEFNGRTNVELEVKDLRLLNV